MKEFSILIPSMDDFDYLKLCLDSLEENSCNKHEICICCVNNNVKDFLSNCTYKNIEIKYIYDKSDEVKNNVSRAYNLAFSLSSYYYIMIADSDHVFSPEWDKNIFSYLCDNKVISIHRIEDTNYFGNIPDVFNINLFLKEYKNYISDKIIENDCFHPFILPRYMWESVGGMNEIFIGALHDDDLWLRLYKKFKCEFIYHCQSVVFHFSGRRKPENLLRSNMGIQEKWSLMAPEVYKSIYGYDWLPVQKLHLYNPENL